MPSGSFRAAPISSVLPEKRPNTKNSSIAFSSLACQYGRAQWPVSRVSLAFMTASSGSESVCMVQRQHVLLQLDAALATSDLLEFGAAHRDIAVVAADLDLWPVGDGAAGLVHAHHHGGLAAGMADGLDLRQLVGPGQQMPAALEQLAAKVGAQAVRAEERRV